MRKQTNYTFPSLPYQRNSRLPKPEWWLFWNNLKTSKSAELVLKPTLKGNGQLLMLLKQQRVSYSWNTSLQQLLFGVRTIKLNRWSTLSQAEKREMIQADIRHEEEQRRKTKTVSMAAQDAWIKLPTTPRKLSWNNIWSYQPLRLVFLLKSVYDVLPSPKKHASLGITWWPIM